MAELERTCSNCKYDMGVYSCSTKEKIMHCYRCFARDEGRSQFLSREADYPSLDCKNCIYSKKGYDEAPCSECVEHSNFEKKRKKSSSTPSSSESQSEKPTPMFEDDISAEGTQSVVKNVNDAVADLAFGMNPCTACEFSETDSEDSNCKGCCFNFPSKFKLRGAK